MAHRLGQPTLALGFLAGHIGHVLSDALDAERVQSHFIRIPGQTRIDVTVVDAAGHATSLYGPGPAVPAGALAQLDETVACWLQPATILVLAGSLLPGVPDDLYARYIELARRRGVRTFLDTGGAALQQGVAALPNLVKPNRSEAAALLGRALPDESAVREGALELRARGIGTVIISMGAQGAICASEQGTWKAVPPEVEHRSTVGSGDSMVAGIAVALAQGNDVLTGLRLGTAAGAATAMAAGTTLGGGDVVARLLPEVELVPLDRREAA